MQRILLLFLDGVGIGPASEELNPFLRARLPTLDGLLGGVPTLDEPALVRGGARSLPLDATLGVDGTPQSGTGQIALLTGRNAPRLHGAHFGPWPPVGLRPLLEEESLLRRARRAGHSVVFANAYPADFPEGRSPRWIAAPPLAARAAGLLDRHAPELAGGRAVASEIENTRWRRHAPAAGIPEVTPEAAGENLVRIARGADLTLFAHYATDHAGHGGRGRQRKDPSGRMALAIRALERVDRFLGGILRALPADTLLVVASDHGNIEDVSMEHTRNPALGLVVAGDGGLRDGRGDGAVPAAPPDGSGAAGLGGGLAGLRRITDIAEALLARLPPPSPRPGGAATLGG